MARNDTLTALNALADQVPGLNQRALQQVQAARDIGLQRQLEAAPTPGRAPVARQAQTLATQRALQAGQDIVTQRQQAARRAEQVRAATLQERQRRGELGLQQRQLAQQERLERQRMQQLQQTRSEELKSRKTVLQDELDASARLQDLGIDQDNRLQLATIKQREDLQRIGLDVKNKLLDSRLQFQKDERGRKFTNERQMADYAAATAKSRQDFNIKMAQMQQAQEQKLMLMKQAQARLETTLERGFITEQDDLDFAAKRELAQLNADMKNKIRKEEAEARNRQAMFQAGGTILGAGVGAVFGGPAGAAAGGAVGGALGSVAGGAI